MSTADSVEDTFAVSRAGPGLRKLFPLPKAQVEATELSRRLWFWGLLGAHLIIIAFIPLIPAQDLPQHISYARILLEYDRPDLRFHDYYVVATTHQSYFTAYQPLCLRPMI